MINKKSSVILVCLAVLVPLTTLWGAAQRDGTYFPETGHNVYDEFLNFYTQRGGLAIFGYPLTKEFEENGLTVQYFQRVRMEKYQDSSGQTQVRLGLLGDELEYRQPPIPSSEIPPATHPDKLYFSETGHTISFAFLEFFNSQGGLEIFGYPITEWVIEPNGRIVQYFQCGKMEWYPENLAGQRVQLGMLGTIYVEKSVDPTFTDFESPFSPPLTPTATSVPVEPTVNIPAVTDIRIMATLKYPIMGVDGVQTIYVYVLDQSGYGVPGAMVEMEVLYNGVHTENLSLGATNINGYGQLEFPIANAEPGYIVLVTLSTRYGDLSTQTSTAFLPWW